MITDRKFKSQLDAELGPLSFGLFMRVARTSLGLTQEQLGKKLGLSRANICDIEKGRHLVSTELAIKVARKAGLSEKMALQATFKTKCARRDRMQRWPYRDSDCQRKASFLRWEKSSRKYAE